MAAGRERSALKPNRRRARPTIELAADPPLTCEVRVSHRARRLRLRVQPQRIEVVVPRGLSPRGRTVRRFVESHRDWLLQTREEAASHYRDELRRRYASGSVLAFRGRTLPLDVTSLGVRTRVRATDSGIVVSLGRGSKPMVEGSLDRLEATRDAIESWLRREARKVLQREAPRYLEALGVTPRGLWLGNNRRAWGTCSGRGIVRVHWRLVQAPPEAMQYVIAHEVAHLVEANHAPAFWQTLESILPEWRTGQEALGIWERELAAAQGSRLQV